MAIFRFLFVAVLAGFLGGSAVANWPQWRGPHLNGTSSTAKNLPVRWSTTENVVWRTKLPNAAAATPIIWNDTVFVTSAEEGFSQASGANDKLFLLALNRKDGSIRWRVQVGEGNRVQRKQNMASPSPVTDGKHVWIMTGTGWLTGLDFSGKKIWQRNIEKDYGAFGLNHGYASSPLLHEGRLYIQVLHGMKTDDPSYAFVVDGATGKTIWKVERPTDAISESPDDYSTPVLVRSAGALQLVISGGDYVTGHDLTSGRELWRMGGLNPDNDRAYRTIASSVVLDGVVYTTSTRGRPFIAFRPGGKGDITGTNLVWKNDLGSDVPTPTTDGKWIYVVNDRGIVVSFDPKTGKVVWDRQRIEPGTYSASPVVADGKIYATNEEGTTTVFATGEEFKILAVNKLADHTLATPAVADNQIFIRTDNYLYCIAEKK
jgi:outer membrane protein assembly factor BamB